MSARISKKVPQGTFLAFMRDTRIELVSLAWEASVLPLY